MNQNKGFGAVVVALILGIISLGLGIFAVHSTLSPKAAGVATGQIIDGANSNDPTKDHFLTVDGILSSTGTSTSAHSPDGYMLYSSFTVSTTTPVRAALTNSYGPAICDGQSLYVFASSTAVFVPAFKVAVGTTTSATLYSANILASTTVGTTTQSILNASTWLFYLPTNASITLSVGDANSAVSSSTYYGSWTGQVGVHCWTAGS